MDRKDKGCSDRTNSLVMDYLVRKLLGKGKFRRVQRSDSLHLVTKGSLYFDRRGLMLCV